MAKFGTLQVVDTLQSLRIANGTVLQYGEDDVWAAVDAAFQAHNELTSEQLGLFAEPCVDRFRRTGGNDSMTMDELDEYGVAQPQMLAAGAEYGIPLRRYGRGLQWTRDYFERTRVQDFAAQVTGIMTADMKNIQRQLKIAFFYPTNYTFIDRLTDGASLPVKRLQNNDTAFPIPVGPNSEDFATNHNHYLGVNGLDDTSAGQLVKTVVEHISDGDVFIYINAADEQSWRNLNNFQPYVDPRVTGAVTVDQVTGVRLNTIRVNNRAIGLYNGAEVWVKPWGVANYPLCFATNTSQRKVLAVRTLGSGVSGTDGGASSILAGGVGAGPGDLRLVFQNDSFPLRANQYQRELGFSVQNRIAAAILYTGGTSYTAPSL